MLPPHEGPSLPRLRSGVHRGGPRLQVRRGGRWGGALGEVWRHFQPAVAAQPIEAARSRRDSGRRSSALYSAKEPGTDRPDSSDVLEVTRLSTSGSLRAVSSGGGGGSSPTSRRRRPVRPSRRLHPPGRLETPAPWPGQGAERGPARRPRTRTAFVSAPVGSRRSAVRRKARRRRLFTHSVRFVKNHAVPSLKKIEISCARRCSPSDIALLWLIGCYLSQCQCLPIQCVDSSRHCQPLLSNPKWLIASRFAVLCRDATSSLIVQAASVRARRPPHTAASRPRGDSGFARDASPRAPSRAA